MSTTNYTDIAPPTAARQLARALIAEADKFDRLSEREGRIK